MLAKFLKKAPSSENKTPLFTPSKEFRAFWGNNIEAAWFKPKSFVSPLFIFLILLSALICYLCSNLLFSPSEFTNFFVTEDEENFITQQQVQKIINHD